MTSDWIRNLYKLKKIANFLPPQDKYLATAPHCIRSVVCCFEWQVDDVFRGSEVIFVKFSMLRTTRRGALFDL